MGDPSVTASQLAFRRSASQLASLSASRWQAMHSVLYGRTFSRVTGIFVEQASHSP